MSTKHRLLRAVRGRFGAGTWLRGLDHRLQEKESNWRRDDVDMDAVRGLMPNFEAVLSENIIDFWLPRCLDRQHGGYLVAFDADGQSSDWDRKGLIVQARMLWFLSRLITGDFETAKHPRAALIAAADSGYQFLRQKLWDPVNCGFYWEVNRAGTTVTSEHKDAYGQAFALFALSQYCAASGDDSARELADELFHVIEDRMHDTEHGGYLEFLTADWGPVPPDVRRYTGPYPQLAKTTNTHLHMLEALIPYYAVAPSPLVRDRLIELIRIQTSTVMRKGFANSYDSFERDWCPPNCERNLLVSFGHDLENIHLVIDACDAVGVPEASWQNPFREVLDQALHNGFDWRNGGFYLYGEVASPAHRREKIWWVQAEAMLGLLYAHQRLQHPRALDAFLRTWQFVDRELIDHRVGEWFDTVRPDGTVARHKGHEWKTAYHNGRAMIRCIEILRSS
jgi:mannose/cellobiose epimerase-like protein (N-acyl-D-glucosamine 2-epimerase family)